MPRRRIVSRAFTITEDTNGRLRTTGKPGETVRAAWVQFVSQETPRMNNWDSQQQLAFESARRPSETII